MLLSILCASCTKELKYSKEQLYLLAWKADPSVTFVVPKSISEGVSCTDYTENCLSAHTVRVKGLELIAVEFLDEASARRAAMKFRGYYVRNWLLDDVTGEPVLERFVQVELKGVKP